MTSSPKSKAKKSRLKKELLLQKFYPTKEITDEWFDIINDEIFNNELSKCEIIIRRLRGDWGYFDGSLVLTDKFPSKAFFLNILAHEMIHAYQHQFGEKDHHGASFWAWEPRFKKYGLYLSIGYVGKHVIK